ncbi:UbiA prenyltransferase family protein [Saccharomonospora viridis]|uniref:4-hydroxybenzoate polyprenyltransferase-like prenyltransferase n=1 Tax=Saccharomonospora viridis (strain ATCC 15386 / DSM 43017 / JCM 3036 / CCUG 5913 / NBRC 12207 / NCIMB 9602 / P101) TaxID=471857 RepID=C7MX85_SACVD|nr:UbiA family prenyltransferase [Saccharomonospora viridis]ACU95894.1 4-hydroxybenzoate polyprenyltransferase-like prenyltransferase [Saccharomonospora viridis DSM 43017]
MPRLTARELAAVHRLEFPFWVNTVCQALWGACFAVAAPTELVAWPVLLAVVANIVLMEAGLVLNAVADLDSDARHPERGRLANAVLKLGGRDGLRLVTAEFVLGGSLAVAVSVWTGHWLVALAAAGTVAAHVLYNVEPMRWKSRGLPGAAVFACGVIALPFVTAHAAVRADLPPEAVLTFGGLTLLATGRVVWWSVPDREADAAAGQRTTSVRHGAVRALALACLLLCAGVFALSWGLWWYGGPVAALVGAGGHVVFTGTVVALLRRVRVRRPTSSTRLRTTVMPVVLAADVLLVGVGLATG